MVTPRILATTLCLLASTAAFAADPLPRAKPEDVGLSSERLARIGETLKADIEAGRILVPSSPSPGTASWWRSTPMAGATRRPVSP